MRKVDDNEIPVFDLTILPIDGGGEADGFDKFAYVENPAIEEMGIYLESADKRIMIDEVTENIIIEYLKTVGRESKPSNWTEKTEEEYNEIAAKTSILQLTRDPMARESWNDITDPSGDGQWLVRYEYEGPQDSKNRTFCARILRINRIYTEEEIKNGLSNPQFGNYSIFDYKGSYGCRHRWRRKIYFESYEDGEVDRRNYLPNFVKSRLNDSDATRYNSLLSSNIHLENSEKQQVVAPLLIPDKKIYREDKNGEYYIRFSDVSIQQIRDKARDEGKLEDLNITKITHKGDIAPAFILEEWIIEDENDKAYTKYGFDKKNIPVGSWMVMTQITDKEFWKEEIIKKKRYAYSIEAFLNMKLVNLNINKNKTNSMKDEKTEIEMLKEQLEATKALLSKLEDKSKSEEEKEDDKEVVVDMEDKDKEDVEMEDDKKDDVEMEDKEEEKTEAEVNVDETEEKKDEAVEEVEVDAQEEEGEESEADSKEDESDEESKVEEDDKFETIFEEIAKIKSMISEMGEEKTKVEMSSQKKSDLTQSLSALAKIMSKKTFG